MKDKRENKFKVGDEAILTKEGKHISESNDYADEAGVKAMRPYVVCKSLFEINVFNPTGKLHDTIYLLGTDNGFLGHPAAKFRKVERLKWKQVGGLQLKRGDIVKPTLVDTTKYIVLSNETFTLKLIPAIPPGIPIPEGYFENEDGTVSFHSVGSFYKLINISEL